MRTKNRGFSLIEIMITVAIVGILSVLAFSGYSKYRLKAYETQIATETSALFSALKVFKSTFGTYFGDFENIGYRPEGYLPFKIGFDASGTSVCPATYGGPGVVPGAASVNFNSDLYCTATGKCTNASGVCPLTAANLLAGDAGVTDTTFLIGTCRYFADDVANTDTWTMNQNNFLVHQIIYQ